MERIQKVVALACATGGLLPSSAGGWPVSASSQPPDRWGRVGHLKGKHTIGLYPSLDGTTKWVCIDIDILEPVVVLPVREGLGERGIHYLMEFSGNKGFQLCIFFRQPSPNHVARALGGPHR